MTDTLLTDIANGDNKLFDENEKLRQQLAKCQVQVTELAEMFARCAQKRIEDEQQLAECQAREKVMRELATEIDATLCRHIHSEKSRFTESLAMPSDSTALDTLLKQAKRETLLEDAAYCDDVQIGSECNLDIASGLRRRAKELE